MYSANLSIKIPYQNIEQFSQISFDEVDLDVQKVQTVSENKFSSDDCYFGKPLPASCVVFGACSLLTSPLLCLGSGFMCKAGTNATLFLTGEIFAGIAAGITGTATCITCTGCTTLAGLIYYLVES